MLVHVLACDYDGTIAEAGVVSPETKAMLARVRESGRKLVLVTGRLLDDLRSVCPDVDQLFDAVVAENGALLYLPGPREAKTLGDPPEPALLAALYRNGVPFTVGASIIASHQAFAEAAVGAIRETGVERSLVFNRGALMLLPGGVTKATGLGAALVALELSAHNTIGVGDGENDHAFLAYCEGAVAVADAVPALRERADLVTGAAGPRGVVELIERHVLSDAIELLPSLRRHWLRLGEQADGTPVAIPAHATRLLIIGPSGSGKSTLTGVLVERLVAAGRAVCLLDPEGDYQTLAEHEGILVLGGKGEQALPTPDELSQLLSHPGTSLVLDLSAMSRTEKVAYATKALAAIAAARATRGLPHWLVVDEAHHVAPADGSSAEEWLASGSESLCLITLSAGDLAPAVRAMANRVASTDLDGVGAAVRALAGSEALGPVRADGPLERGEAVIADLRAAPIQVDRFRVGRRRLAHRRHLRKYAEGELPPERSFYFRGPEGKLSLRAANLSRFCELADGIDEATWSHHLGAGEYSAWLAAQVKDPELAEEVAVIETAPAVSPADSRRRVLEAIRRRYTV
jgi:hydroxymethylpyrimidine pyrophosphatase-like HAD family hydrolase